MPGRWFFDHLQIGINRALPDFAPTMPDVCFLVLIRWPDETHRILDGLLERGLVPLDGQQVVGSFADDGLGNVPLASHGIDRDDASLHVEQFQQLRNGGDLVAFFRGGRLPKTQAALRGKGGNHMQGRAFVHLVDRSTNRLAIDGNELFAHPFIHQPDPLNEPKTELFGIDERENPVDRIVRWNSVSKSSVLDEPLLLRLAEKNNLFPIIRSAHHSRDNQQDDVVEFVLVIAPGRATWVSDLAEQLLETIRRT